MDRLCIDVLVRDDCFSSSLLRLLGEEESHCKDVHRLTALIDVSLGLLSPDNDGVRQKVRWMATVNVSWSQCSQLCLCLVSWFSGRVEICMQTVEASLSKSTAVSGGEFLRQVTGTTMDSG